MKKRREKTVIGRNLLSQQPTTTEDLPTTASELPAAISKGAL